MSADRTVIDDIMRLMIENGRKAAEQRAIVGLDSLRPEPAARLRLCAWLLDNGFAGLPGLVFALRELAMAPDASPKAVFLFGFAFADIAESDADYTRAARTVCKAVAQAPHEALYVFWAAYLFVMGGAYRQAADMFGRLSAMSGPNGIGGWPGFLERLQSGATHVSMTFGDHAINVPLRLFSKQAVTALLSFSAGQLTESAEIARLLRFMPRGGTFVDVGHLVGEYTLSFMTRTECAAVVAFDGNAAATETLSATLRGLPDLGRPVEWRLETAFLGRGDDGTRSLDSFGLTTADVVKIDVDGYEFDLLHGARDTLRRLRPVVQIEVKDVTEAPVRRFFGDLGYRAVDETGHGDYRNIVWQPKD